MDTELSEFAEDMCAARGWAVVVKGRVVPAKWTPHFDATASRRHGASFAGLVVGAMGVFVFTVALRHRLGERTRFREDVRA